MAIPIIDFTKCGLLTEREDQVDKCDMRKVGGELYEAFSTSGFAYLKGTGISREKVNGINYVAGKFFDLPLVEKNKFVLPRTYTFGYDALGTLHTDRRRPRDLQEGFRVSVINIDTKWPEIPQFEEKVTEFHELCKRLTLRILRALGIGMKLKDPDYLYNCHEHMNQPGNCTALKLHQYPPITKDNPLLGNQFRVGEHTDVGTMTVLFQDEMGGLQIQNLDGDFIDATPIPDTVILNIGDALQLWSGGRLKSTFHRVVQPVDEDKRSKIRRSVAYFTRADSQVVMKKFEFEDDEKINKPTNCVPDMTFDEYIYKRLDYFFPEIPQ